MNLNFPNTSPKKYALATFGSFFGLSVLALIVNLLSCDPKNLIALAQYGMAGCDFLVFTFIVVSPIAALFYYALTVYVQFRLFFKKNLVLYLPISLVVFVSSYAISLNILSNFVSSQFFKFYITYRVITPY